MANYRNISTQIWRDKDFVTATKEGKLIFLYLIANTGARESGVYFVLPSDIAATKVATEAQVAERLAGGQGADAGLFRNVYYDFERGAVFVVNFRLYQKAAGGRPDLLTRAIANDRSEVRTKLWALYDCLYDEFGVPKPDGYIPEELSCEMRAKGGPAPRRRIKKVPGQDVLTKEQGGDVSRETSPAPPAVVLAEVETAITEIEKYRAWPRDNATREKERVMLAEAAMAWPDVDLKDAAAALRVWLEGRGRPPKNYLLQFRNWIKGSHDKGLNLKTAAPKGAKKRGFMPPLEEM